MRSFGAFYFVTVGGIAGMIVAVTVIAMIYAVEDRLPPLRGVLIAFGAVLVTGFLIRVQRGRPASTVGKRKRTKESAHVERLALAGEISASIIHEIAQPLSSILVNIEAMELLCASGDGDATTVAAIVADMKRDQDRANKIVRRLRSFLSDRQLQLEDANINEMIAGVLDLLNADFKKRNIVVHANLASELPRVAADPVHLEQVLLNLVVNAMEAMIDTPSLSRLIQVSTRRIDKGRAEVIVSDSGSGMTRDQLARAFNMFFTTKKTGMGLGLSISRSIILAHHGAIWVEPRFAGGTSVHFTIPLAVQ